jgi:hypothetical protein
MPITKGLARKTSPRSSPGNKAVTGASEEKKKQQEEKDAHYYRDLQIKRKRGNRGKGGGKKKRVPQRKAWMRPMKKRG